MPPPFRQLSLQQFAALVESFNFTRTIVEVHMHHTWRPSHSQYQGEKTINGMWRHHTAVNGWSDIAQHITIAPDGTIWLGRNWNKAPASSGGFNGTSKRGPFMFEIVGDFDVGRDPFEGAQRDTVIGVIAHVQRRFGLAPTALRFHNEMSGKTCPGNSIKKSDVIELVRAFDPAGGLALAAHAPAITRSVSRGPFDASFIDGAGASDMSRIARELEAQTEGDDPFDAEPTHEDEVFDFNDTRASRSRSAASRDGARAARLTAADMRLLRPHVINLRQGDFSESGEYQTTKQDVDTIVDVHMKNSVANATTERPLRIMIMAHGGLTSETSALNYAHAMRGWWLANNVYPLFFVWETGLFETLSDMFAGARRSASRARGRGVGEWVTDHISDPALEKLARLAQGERIWAAMKWSAEKASDRNGGARHVANRLREFVAANPGKVELHAVGHSAGSIFHAHFLNALVGNGDVKIATLHLLAPAIRSDMFRELLAPVIRDYVGATTIFTMDRDTERADNCGKVYQKSLLYLIYYALENRVETDVLGLQVSIERDRIARELFGLEDPSKAKGEIIWSPSEVTVGQSAAGATTHGGFDNDPLTMTSVLRRIVRAGSHGEVRPFPYAAQRALDVDPWDDRPALPDELLDALGIGPSSQTGDVSEAGALDIDDDASIGLDVTTDVTADLPPVPEKHAAPSREARTLRALCVGIDSYPGQELSGCVADARQWRKTLEKLGFTDIRMLLDTKATRVNMVAELERLVKDCRPGDTMVFQYSGHGTYLRDVDGDESGDSDNTRKRDEAYCPIDVNDGHLLTDDDVRRILSKARADVSIRLFTDCCHSASNSRARATALADAPSDDARPRFLVADAGLRQRHLAFRASLGESRAPASKARHNGVQFAACRSDQVAWESNGSGDFTKRATKILAGDIAGMTNEQFQKAVLEAFGAGRRQTPVLDVPNEAAKKWALVPGTSVAVPS